MIAIFVPRLLETYIGQWNLVDGLFYLPEMYARWMFFLSEVFCFFHPRFQLCSLELCVPYLYNCEGLLKLEHEQLGGFAFLLLSFYEHAAWSKIAQVLLIYLSSHSLVVIHRSPSQLEAEVKQLGCIIVIRVMSCSRKGGFCIRQKVHAFINLNDQGYRTLSLCWNVV